MFENIVSAEKPNHNRWTIDILKSKLLQQAAGVEVPYSSLPDELQLNSLWIDIMESLFYVSENVHKGRTVFYYEHEEENARILKTDLEKTRVLVSKKNQMGSGTYINVDMSKVKQNETLLGILHKHPGEATFSSSDLRHFLTRPVHFIAGITTPRYYYFALRSAETPKLPDNELVAKGFMLAMAQKHGAWTSSSQPNNEQVFIIDERMMEELKIGFYKGLRGSNNLNRITTR